MLPCSNYIVVYSINGGTWDTIPSPGTIPANGTITVNAIGLDLSAPGDYHFTVAVKNLALTDPQPANDTLRFTIKNIPNDTITLPFTDGFEDMPVVSVTGRDTLALSPNGHWDFTTNDSAGRMRSYVNENVTISGNRSISLDENQSVIAGSNNLFTGTFNLGAYDTGTTEIRLDFDYILHGTPKSAAGNEVSFRSTDNIGWAPFFTYDLNAYPGSLNKARSLSVTDAARAQNKNFSSSTQISFGQNDTSLIAARNYGNGISIDNVQLYTVANDAQMVKVVSPLPANCGLAAAQPLTVQVHNGVNYTLRNITVFYREDGGTIHTGIIDSITAKNTIDYTFTQLLDMPAGTSHSIDVWLSAPGDTYLPNDTLINYKFRNSIIVTGFPYLENFETGTGGYYSDGVNNSWQYGTPAAPSINNAASGTKAWKTNLTGRYNNLEQSYLYTPCFDIAGMNTPMLSFSAALDIENCGNVLCDKAYIEYSYNGVSWIKLGSAGNGTNWYDSTYNAWTSNGFTRWHVASIPVPKPVGSGSVINFRFVLSSDPGANFEGFAVDDVHIYDLAHGILPANSIAIADNDLSGNNWTDFLKDNKLIASLQPENHLSGNTSIVLYPQDTYHNATMTQYLMPRSYNITPVNAPADSIGVTLYLTDSELVNVLQDTTCPSCPSPRDAYRLGITQFSNALHPSLQNNILADDSAGQLSFLPYTQVQWVPYDKGYYARFKTKQTGEMWLNDGGPTHTFAATDDYLNFTAYRSGISAQVIWTSLIDTSVNEYTVERSIDSVNFNTAVITIPASHIHTGIYRISDNIAALSSSDIYYRLKWTMTGSSTVYYSPVRKLAADDSINDIVRVNARMISKEAVLVDWTSYIDGVCDHYLLERKIGNGDYTSLGTITARHHYGQYYSYTDIPGGIAPGTLVRYKLTAVFSNGNYLYLPECLVEWAAPNTVSNVFPNPSANGTLNIVWYALPGTTLQADLIDMQGKTLHVASDKAGQWQNTTTLTTPFKPHGVYLLRTIIGERTLTKKVRIQAKYHRSLEALRRLKEGGMRTKSGIMLGLGETKEEVLETLQQLADNGVDVVTIGQYLQPTQKHLPVVRFVHPDEFAEFREAGYRMGIDYVESGPLVRSSYHSERHVFAGEGRRKWEESKQNGI